MANDPFDVTNSDGDNGAANFFRNLQAFGGATMQAANTYGPNGFLTYGAGPMGALGVGLNQAAQQSRENAEAQQKIALTGAQAQQQRQQNQLFPLQLQMMRQQAAIMNNIFPQNEQQPNPPPGNPTNPNVGQNGQGGSSAGATNAPNQVSRPSANQLNNTYNIRPTGASTGFIPSNGEAADENLFYKDMLSKIDGSSLAMQSKFGKNYQPTLQNIVSTFAPPSENNTQNYLDVVSKGSGIAPNQNLRASDISRIAPYFKQMETGTPANAEQNNDYQSKIMPNQQELAMTAMDKFMPGVGKIGEAQYAARIAPIVEGAKKESEQMGGTTADAQKNWNTMSNNLPVMLNRLQEMRNVASNASFGVGSEGEDGKPGMKQTLAYQMAPYGNIMGYDAGATANANGILEQRVNQGVLPEIAPVLQTGGMRGNKFLESIVAGAAGLDLAADPKTKVSQIDGLEENYINTMKSAAGQARTLGVNVPTDEQIDAAVKQYKTNPSSNPAAVTAQNQGVQSVNDLASKYKNPRAIGFAYKNGEITREQATTLLQQNHGLQ